MFISLARTVSLFISYEYSNPSFQMTINVYTISKVHNFLLMIVLSMKFSEFTAPA